MYVFTVEKAFQVQPVIECCDAAFFTAVSDDWPVFLLLPQSILANSFSVISLI